ncbi:MAG: hypothetical protein HY536_01645, partial [Candidatus Colwellbacteria bacterium]|nr:hypothetical protein [Candidatus Colwellbacteria bacterium]
WRVGDTYNVSIGQGDLLVTPIALLNSLAAIVNGGTLWAPKLVAGAPPRVLRDDRDFASELAEVVRGMRDGVAEEYGTAHLLSSLPLSAVGKTGSAQIMNNTKINAFFTGCAPVPWSDAAPPLCLLVLVENAKGGSLNAGPVARDVFDWYYENRLSAR